MRMHEKNRCSLRQRQAATRSKRIIARCGEEKPQLAVKESLLLVASQLAIQ